MMTRIIDMRGDLKGQRSRLQRHVVILTRLCPQPVNEVTEAPTLA